ncbi:hypothetical protein HJD18_08280 [Thermoleophilia bacterium SCSIO 60948]|nr:hypothetical protein HJD18_08280 [Thermoleophilia bacterium SCSIO 60948]
MKGDRRIELSVPAAEVDRIRLHYGRLGGGVGWASGSRRVALQPCPDRFATSFPGGIAIRGRDPVELRIEVEGETEPRSITIGRV